MNPGTRLGPYEILAPIGAGGMGEVYRARDPRLARDVAIKVLPAAVSRDPQALARFEREAKAVAALSHPNILAIFDVGSEDGVSYVVTELLEGETLRARLHRGGIAWRKTAEIGAALAEGLAAAHAKGITHRDLKPENMFLTSDGRVKILDFGLARFQPAESSADETATQTLAGTVMGTIGYMSPEQVRGAPAGPRSDIFALGCVLYEMISGRRAFEAKTPAETLSSILRDTPAELSTTGNQIPSEIGHLISHCLEKSPEERFQSARDLAFGLKAALSSSTDSGVSASARAVNSIAVLPFANASRDPDSEYLSDGITESIINSLVQLSQLRVTPRSTVFRYKGRDVDPQAIGQELKVRVVLTGRVVQRGETLVVGAELIDVAEGSQLWGERYNRKLADIFELEEEIARKISESLRLKLTGEEQKRLAKRFTEDSEAYQLYLKGRHYWIKRTPDNLKKGAEHFQQAIAKDPGYALAYAGLADCYSILSLYVIIPPREGWAKAKTAAAAAIALNPELAEGHASQGLIRTFLDWEWVAAEKEFKHAAELNPAYWVTPYWYSLLLNAQGRHEEADQQVRYAQGLEPLSPVIAFASAFTSYCAQRYAETIHRCLKGIEIDPAHPLLRMWLGAAYEAQSQYQEAIRELEIGTKLLEGSTMCIGWLAHAHASAGNRAQAEGLLQTLLEHAEKRVVEPFSMILAYSGLGEQEQALNWLEKACDSYPGLIPFLLKTDSRLDQLRTNPRFVKVLQRMGLQA